MPRNSVDTPLESLPLVQHASNFRKSAAMAFSTSVSLLLVATVCCFIVNAAEERPFLPSVANRQSKQMFYMPSSLFNYYNPYGAQIMVPTAGRIQPEFLSSGGSELAPMEKIFNQSEDISLSPAATACTGTAGYTGCTVSSSAASGTISVTFAATGQGATVAISPRNLLYTRVKFTCNTLTDVIGFTKTAKLTATGVMEVTENKPAVLIVVVDGAKTSGTLKCSWTSLM
ncbi:hypothetical protein DAPPUDRAFT_315119 [Daphnia pulex]|uniref:Uncharacterized protein n=1 Tax=Daphnia pulex TaxID=6669 RepID=E9G8T2_DAPPU|nr:hypothetical protein DAPPUDRAFT_315119 [Daphnia pulex]|eukprot:EFX84028.1 hypothetical protein DAPPUDRAFT_315119 [Daphnia pulex]